MATARVRVNILRNGESSGGSVVLKPPDDDTDGWNKFLAACSRKLGGEPITRLFTCQGFAIDELEEILAGETLVCSSGADFLPVAPTPSRLTSTVSSASSSANELHSLLASRQQQSDERSSVMTPPLAERMPTSSSAQSAPSTPARDASRATPEPFTPPGVGTPPPPVVGVAVDATAAMAPMPHAHLTVLQAAPLTSRSAGGQVLELPLLNLRAEREALLEALRASGRELSVLVAPATTDALGMAITRGTQVLHWSGHGEENCVKFEDGGGGAQDVSPSLLASTCRAGSSTLKLVFVCACHSQSAATAFIRAGVPHVVAVRSRALVLDQSARHFTRHFYLGLFCGHTVRDSFEAAQAAVRAMPRRLIANQPADEESRKFVLLPELGDVQSEHHHAVAIFDRPLGELTDRSTPLCASNMPALSENFVGRQRVMQSAVQALTGLRRRCVCIVGAGGIGKSALALAVCDYVRLRHCFPDGTFHVDARGLSDVLQLTYAIASALGLPTAADSAATEEMVRAELVGHLATKVALLYIDRCDHLTGPLFGSLVSAVLRRAPKVKLLLTCRKSLGIVDETPLTISIDQLTPYEAKLMLQHMAPNVPPAHATALAELCGNMPLALRLCGCALASQRVKVTPDQLITRLEGEKCRLNELRKLSSGTGDESVEACIASSYNSLSPPLQLAFLALCEFPGSFDTSAASALLSGAFQDSAMLPLLRELRSAKHVVSDDSVLEDDSVAGLMQALMDDSMIEPQSAANAPSVARGTPQSRYRLHELIRLFGSGKLGERGDIGRAAQAAWRERMVRHWTGWLGEQSEQWRSASLAAIQMFDLERHNIEAALALARDACAALFPGLLTSGRLLLRHRLDPGSRCSLLTSAVEAASGGGSLDGEHLTASLHIEMGYALGEQQQRPQQCVEYIKAILQTAGREAAETILSEAGVLPLANGIDMSCLTPTASASAAPSEVPAEAASEEERAHEEALLRFLADSGVRSTPEAAHNELCAEALNMLGVSLDVQNNSRASQIILSHAVAIRRNLLGHSHHEVAASYNNLANLLRKPIGRRGGYGHERAAEMQLLVESLYRRAITIREAKLGLQSPQLAASLSNLSVFILHSMPDSIDEAEALLRRGLSIRLAVFGETHGETAHSYHLLGNLLYYHRKDFNAAERLYQKALAVRDQYYTRQSDRAAQTLFNLAHLAREKGEGGRAEKLFDECLAIREQVCGQTHIDSIKTAEQLAGLYRQQGRTEDASRLHGQIAEWRKRQTDVIESAGEWLRAEVPFPLSVEQIPKDFNLKSKIYGHRSFSISHIQKTSGAQRVFLRDDSGAAVLHVIAGSDHALNHAVKLCREHFEKIRADIERFKQHAGRKHTSTGGSQSQPQPQRYGAGGRADSGSQMTLADFIKPASRPRGKSSK